MTASLHLVAPGEAAAYWSEGTRSRIVLDASDTDGALSVLDELLPPGAGPPLHSHPEEETYVVVSGELTVWSVAAPEEDASVDPWTDAVRDGGVRLGAGDRLTVPGGRAHSYRVHGAHPVRVLVLSRPSGLEAWTRRFGVPATAAGLPPTDLREPPVTREQIVAFSRSVGVRRHGPPAPGTARARGAGVPGAAPERTSALALQPGVAHVEPGAPNARVYFVAGSTATLAFAGEAYAAVAGSFVFVPPGAPHAWSATDAARVFVLV